MFRPSAQFACVLAASAALAPLAACAEPLTVAQAESLSKATGRPILAVAGLKS